MSAPLYAPLDRSMPRAVASGKPPPWRRLGHDHWEVISEFKTPAGKSVTQRLGEIQKLGYGQYSATPQGGAIQVLRDFAEAVKVIFAAAAVAGPDSRPDAKRVRR